jgi:glycosyltransferase involved in cell wall biosynthesis
MKIAVVGPTYPFRGGIAHYTSLLVRHLRLRHEVFFASYSRQYPRWLYPGKGDRDPSRELLLEEIPQCRIDAVNPIAWCSLGRRIAREGSALVILPWTVAYWAPFYWLFLRQLRKWQPSARVLFLCHNVREHESAPWKRRLSLQVLAQADFLIAHSREEARHLQSMIGKSSGCVIQSSPHPVYQHLNRHRVEQKQARDRLGIRRQRVLLFFGFIREYKGLRYLLESLPLILKELEIHLVVAGEVWGSPAEYQALIQRLDVSEFVTFSGDYVPNEMVEDYFAAADLVVAPYLSATQSGIVQLAYGFEKPVVASRVGGIPEVVLDGITGYLVPPADPGAISHAVVDFFQKGRGPAMSASIREELGRFSWDKMVETIERFLEN